MKQDNMQVVACALNREFRGKCLVSSNDTRAVAGMSTREYWGKCVPSSHYAQKVVACQKTNIGTNAC